MWEAYRRYRCHDDVVDDSLVGDLVHVDDDCVDVDVVDCHKLLDDGLLDKGGGID